MGALHPPLVSHPPFIFAPRCRIGCKKIVFNTAFNITFSSNFFKLPTSCVSCIKNYNSLPSSPLDCLDISHSSPKRLLSYLTFIPLKLPTKAIYLLGVGAKKDGCEAVSHPGAKKNFWSWSKKGGMRKGGWVRKGGCGPVSHPGAKKIFRALRARTHLWKILCTPLILIFIKLL